MKAITSALQISCILITVLLAGSASAASVDLTTKEMAFIKKNPVVTLASGRDFDPFTIQNADGSTSGLDVDVANLITERTGLAFRFVLGDWNSMVERASQREFDGLTASISSDQRKQSFNFSNPYATLSPLVIVKSGNPRNIFRKPDLRGKKLAAHIGNKIHERFATDNPEIGEIVYCKGLQEVIRSVVAGEADFTVLDETIFYLASKIGLSGFIEGVFPIGTPYQIVFSLRNDRPELVQIVNKGLQNINENEWLALRAKWLGYGPAIRRTTGSSLKLNLKEKQFLETHKTLRLCVAPDRMPLEGIGNNGEYTGIAAELLIQFKEQLGTDNLFVAVPSKNPHKDLVENRCDLVMMDEVLSTQPEGLEHTTPYVDLPYVVVTTDEKVYLDGITTDDGNTYCVVNNSDAIARLRKEYPGIILKEVDSAQDGLRLVRDRTVFGFIGQSVSAAYAIQRSAMQGLIIAGTLYPSVEFAITSSQSSPELNHIFQKLVGGGNPNNVKAAINKWTAVKYVEGVSYSMIWKIVALSAAIIIIIVLWNRQLVAAKEKTQQAHEKLSVAQNLLKKKNSELEHMAVTDRLTGLANRMKLDVTLQSEVARTKRYGHPLTVILMDIDHFKIINDKLGHQAGDKVLQNIAKTIQNNVRSVDLPGRWGGEEFMIICPETDLQGGLRIANKLRNDLENWNVTNLTTATGSFGVAELRTGEDEDELVRRVDKALYNAKKKGRNRVEQA